MIRMRSMTCVAIGLIFAFGVNLRPIFAGFLGSDVLLEAYYPDLNTLIGSWGPVPVVDPDVYPDIEFPVVFEAFPSGDPVWSADVDDFTIQINHMVDGNNLGNADFNGFVFTFTDLDFAIAGVTLNPSSTLIPANFWATGDQVFVDYAGLGIINSGIFTLLDVTFVPAPTTLSLLAVGGLCLRRRRRRALHCLA